MATWLSGAKRQSWGRDGGSFTTSPDKILLHSTETGSFPGYGGGASAPHFTIDLGNGEVRQHSPMNRAARALRNASGGVQTNRDGVIQIEIIGTCDKIFARKYGYPYLPDMSDEMAGRLKWLLREDLRRDPGDPAQDLRDLEVIPQFLRKQQRAHVEQPMDPIQGHPRPPARTGEHSRRPRRPADEAHPRRRCRQVRRFVRWRVRLHRRRPRCPAGPVRQRRRRSHSRQRLADGRTRLLRQSGGRVFRLGH